MAEVQDAMAAQRSTTTESEGTTTDEDVHLSPTCVFRGGGGGRIKLLCSFSGRIIPRPSDGALKYIGGETRVLAVPRSIPFREMKKKVEEMFKTEVAAIKYQLLSLSEDLDVLVSVTCDEDLAHMLDEYDRLEAKRSPTASPRFRVYVFAPQKTPLPAAAPASSRYAGLSRHYPHQHHHFQPERYVATVPVTPSESPRYLPPSHGTVSAGNSPRASGLAAEPPVFEGGRCNASGARPTSAAWRTRRRSTCIPSTRRTDLREGTSAARPATPAWGLSSRGVPATTTSTSTRRRPCTCRSTPPGGMSGWATTWRRPWCRCPGRSREAGRCRTARCRRRRSPRWSGTD